MKCDLCGGQVVERNVSYTIEFNERLHIIEHVPAKECLQCGERLYTPETVEKSKTPSGRTGSRTGLSKHLLLITWPLYSKGIDDRRNKGTSRLPDLAFGLPND